MTEAPTPEIQALFDSMVNERGGLSALNAVHLEIVAVCSRLLIEIRAADGSEIAKIAATIASLQSSLPPPTTPTDKPLDLTRLTDAELVELERLTRIMAGEVAPTIEPIIVERERGASEIEGAALGRFIDEHCERWLHGGLTAGEANTLRNGYQAMSRGYVARNLWRDLWQSEFEASVRERTESALASIGRTDVTIEKPTEFERRIGSIHDGGLLGPNGGQAADYSQFFTGNAGRFDNRT